MALHRLHIIRQGSGKALCRVPAQQPWLAATIQQFQEEPHLVFEAINRALQQLVQAILTLNS